MNYWDDYGNKFRHIKAVRARTNCELREARRVVDEYFANIDNLARSTPRRVFERKLEATAGLSEWTIGEVMGVYDDTHKVTA